MTASPLSAPPWTSDAVGATLCNFGTAGAAYAAGAAWGSAYTGQIWGVVGFAATSAALAAAAAANGCYSGPVDPPPSSQQKICCKRWSEPSATVWWYNDEGSPVWAIPELSGRDVLYSVTPRPDIEYEGFNKQNIYYDFVVSTEGGGGSEEVRVGANKDYATSGCWSLHGNTGYCVEEGGEPPPGDAPKPGPIPFPDPGTGCNWSISMETSYLNAAGNIVILYKATADDPEQCGGPIYWWEEPGKPPVIVQPDPRGPTNPIPPPNPLPDKDSENCCDEIMNRFDNVDKRFNDVDGDLVQIMNDTSEIKNKLPDKGDDWDWTDWIDTVSDSLIILEALSNWLGTGTEEDGNFPGVNYQLAGGCEEPDEKGNQPMKTVPIVPTGGLYAVIARVDALTILLQAHLGYKTPTCSGTPQLEGDWRTISFISDETSPEGAGRLRKRFRYRSSSGIGLDGVINHWKDFSFTAGAVCVSHKGASWGAPQVWASSIDEAKRVIRHAAGEAGIDPDQVGRWLVGGSNNPRYGMPGTMRVNTKGGYYWITARDGSNNRPDVGRPLSDPGVGV